LPPCIFVGICALLSLQTGAAFLTALFFARLYKKALGGYSGDTLGAAIETAEIAALVVGVVMLV
jgi:cobalamin synthase